MCKASKLIIKLTDSDEIVHMPTKTYSEDS